MTGNIGLEVVALNPPPYTWENVAYLWAVQRIVGWNQVQGTWSVASGKQADIVGIVELIDADYDKVLATTTLGSE